MDPVYPSVIKLGDTLSVRPQIVNLGCTLRQRSGPVDCASRDLSVQHELFVEASQEDPGGQKSNDLLITAGKFATLNFRQHVNSHDARA